MVVNFSIGNTEKYDIKFSWGKFLGVAKIFVNEKMVLKTKPKALSELSKIAAFKAGGILGKIKLFQDMKNINLFAQWNIKVGEHEILFVKERPLLLAGLRKHKLHVYCGSDIVFEGYV